MNILQLILIIASIETGGHSNPNQAIGDNGKAVGVLQIHPIMVRECNRLVGHKKFTLADRNDTTKSFSMAMVFLPHQKRRYERRYGRSPSKAKLIASWNSGSIFRPCTNSYKRKISERLKNITNSIDNLINMH
jgi:hypothetical protein